MGWDGEAVVVYVTFYFWNGVSRDGERGGNGKVFGKGGGRGMLYLPRNRDSGTRRSLSQRASKIITCGLSAEAQVCGEGGGVGIEHWVARSCVWRLAWLSLLP